MAGASTASARYLLEERSASEGAEATVCNDVGQLVFRLDRDLESKHLVLRDARGMVLFSIACPLAATPADAEIRRAGGQLAARVKPRASEGQPTAFDIDVVGGSNLRALGDIHAHEYRIERGQSAVAEVSKRRSGRDNGYVAQVLPGQNDGLLLAVVLGIDALARVES
jgi:uncharacterized protein YxjI